MYILNFIRGFCMALADSVPGVSGGTIAFILGFYDDFVNSLNHLISGNKQERLKALNFLSKIGIGWIIGFILSVIFITSIFEKNIYDISSLFLGFIIASIPLIIKSEKKSLLKDKYSIIFLFIGIAIVSIMTYFNPMTGKGNHISMKMQDLTLMLNIYIFISGTISISAMVLPGISGSTILLIFGLYAPILGAIKQAIKLNYEYIPVLLVFGSGVFIGILITVRSVRYLLAKFRTQTIYCIIGLMIGSIYAVIMGPTSLEVPKNPLDLNTFNMIFFIVGGALVPLLEKLKLILNKKRNNLNKIQVE